MRPLRDGVISDYEMTEKMLEQFLKKINKFTLVKPRVIVSVPSGITEVEERAVIQAAMEAGARRVYLIEEPFAAARLARSWRSPGRRAIWSSISAAARRISPF